MGSGASGGVATSKNCRSATVAKSDVAIPETTGSTSSALVACERYWVSNADREAAEQAPKQKKVPPAVMPQGVVFDESTQMYEAHIRATSGRFVFLGQHETAEEAHQKYLEALPIHCPGKKVLGAKNGVPASGDQTTSKKGKEEATSRDNSILVTYAGLDNAERPEEFHVIVDSPFSSGGGLGLQVQRHNNSSLSVVMLRSGALLDWNLQNPRLDLRIGDQILSVNGVGGNVEKMLAAFRDGSKIDLHVRIPREFSVTLTKAPGQLIGLDVLHKAGVALEVLKIEEGGLVKAWNDANADRAIKVRSCIVDVNGVRGSSDDMTKTIEFDQVLNLTIREPLQAVRSP